MKKMMTILLAVCLMSVMLLSGAAADGEYTILRQDFRAYESKGTVYVHGYAVVQNTGDKPIERDKTQIEFINEAGETVLQASSFMINLKPETLMPGEYGYLSSQDWGADLVNPDEITGMSITLEGQKPIQNVQRFSCETEWMPDFAVDKWFTHDYMVVTVINDTDETVYGLTSVLALTDAEGRILYVIGESVNNNIGVPPGSSMVIRKEIAKDITEGYQPEDLKVDAIAYKTSY